MWSCVKEFHFDYGHRIWSQKLNTEFSIDCKCACRFPHGHSGKVRVRMEADQLVDGMVTDFKNLNWFKKFIDEEIDHKFLMDKSDPLLFEILSKVNAENFHDYFQEMPYGHWKYNNQLPLEGALTELYEGFVVVPFLPTSENLSKWLYDIAAKKMQHINIKITQVDFYETQKSFSRYEA